MSKRVSETQPVRNRTKPDAELSTIKRIMRIMEKLPRQTRIRVMEYCVQRCNDQEFAVSAATSDSTNGTVSQ